MPCEDLPGRFRKSNTVWKRFDRWCAAGVWERLAKAPGDPELEEVQLDSTTIKAHLVASTGLANAEGKNDEADARRCLGRSRGGLTTKLHAAVDRCGRLEVTAGQRGDAPRAEGLLEGFGKGTVGYVVADAAYDSDAIQERARRLRAKACIRPNPTLRVSKRYDKER